MESQLKTNKFSFFYNKWLLLAFSTNLFISKLVLKFNIFNKLLKFAAEDQLLWVYAKISTEADYSWDTEYVVHFWEQWVKKINKAEKGCGRGKK